MAMQRREHPWIERGVTTPSSSGLVTAPSSSGLVTAPSSSGATARVGAISGGTGALMTIGGGLLGGWLGYNGHAPKWIGSGVGAIGGATIGGAAGFFLYKLISDPSTAV